jgi:CO/xanthine dehydrogenase Mo-binding subunit
VAEPATIPVAAVIANAIADAVGVRIRDLPITPEKIVQALAEDGRAT